MKDFDLIVIGGGSTGLSAAHPVANAGKKVALIDRGPIGGLCSLAGCNPKKVFVRATEVLQEVRDASQHGIDAESSMHWHQVWERKRRFTEPATANSERSLAASGVELIQGEAQFVSPAELRVGSRKFEAEGFVIATGSHPRRLTWPGAEHLSITDDALELQRPPARMVILGAGVVAFEFGHVFARLGTQVTIVMRTTRALANFDDDFLEPLLEYSRALGIEFLTNSDARSIERSNGALRVSLSTGISREADFVLNAAGRVPSIEELDLAAAGVEADKKGVIVDEYLRSKTNRRVFAGGDAHGRWQLSPIASYEGRIIARNFLEGDTEPADYRAIPHAVFTVPPVAAVGLTEADARTAGRKVVVRKNRMTDWTVYAIAGAHLAYAKVLLDADSDRILGAQLLGEGAAENIHIFALAIAERIPAGRLRQMVYAYPTFASATPHLV